jgi:hypothetical protein
LLEQIDTNPDSHRDPLAEPGLALGQGTWPGLGDSIVVDDFDSDGYLEVAFGTFDGCFHVLELEKDDVTQPPKLVDEWKSPYLGWGMVASATSELANSYRIWVTDSTGVMHQIRNGNIANQYNASIKASYQTLPDHLYQGQIPLLYRGDFDPGSPTDEFLVMNSQLDWALLNNDGTAVGSVSKLSRPEFGTGLGRGFVADMELDPFLPRDHLVLPGRDGHIWILRKLDPPDLEVEHYMHLGNYAILRLIPAEFDSPAAGKPSHILAFARNSTLAEPNRIMVIDTSDPAPQVVADCSTEVKLDQGHTSLFAFTWIDPPQPGGETATFVIADSQMQKFELDINPPGPFECSITGQTPKGILDYDESLGVEYHATSLGFIPAGQGYSLSDQPYVVLALSNGRIYFLDEDLDWSRTSVDPIPSTPSGEEQPWHSNRTLAHLKAFDLTQDDGGGGADEVNLYFADYQSPYRRTPGSRGYRVGKMDLTEVSSGPTVLRNLFSEFETDADFHTDAEYSDMTRFLRFQDLLDANGEPGSDGVREYYFLGEAGTIIPDGTVLRQFSTETPASRTSPWAGMCSSFWTVEQSRTPSTTTSPS